MVFFQINIVRFLTVHIVILGMSIFCFIISLLVIKRGRKRLNYTFSGFYLCSGIAALINVIYAFLFVNPAVLILHFITYYLFCFAFIFLLLFNLIIIKSEKLFSPDKQLIIIILYAALLLILAFIPNGLKIDQTTNWEPKYSLIFFCYAISIVSCIGIIPNIYLSIKIYKEFENESLKKKWKLYFIGMCIYFVIFYLTSLANYLSSQEYNLILSIILFTSFPAILLVYFGVGRQLEN